MPTPCIRRSPPIPENLGFPVTPAPIEPDWGPLKRYTEQCTEKTYHQAVAAAEWLYAYMRSVEGGPQSLSCRALERVPPALWPSPPLTLQLVKSYLGSQILAWENVRMAALEGDWTLIQVGYNRQTDMVAARMQQNPTRRKFIAWAVNYLREQNNEEITKNELLDAWNAIPSATRRTMLCVSKVPKCETYFGKRCGVKLTMEELWQRVALEVPEISPAPSQADGAQESGGDGYTGEAGTGEE